MKAVPADGRRWDSDLLKDLGVCPEILTNDFLCDAWNDIVVVKKEMLPALGAVLQRRAPHIQAKGLMDYWFEMDSRVVHTALTDARAARRQGVPVYHATKQEQMRADYIMQSMVLCILPRQGARNQAASSMR
ncbi:hypothetical protein GCM10016455_30810 [Aliiroseovarius zhejiangensis]|uniref:Uncharacterized protein n=1 Tax=Aliiroseovarius zhejiangensis TaxID=1632025 RepID=A0ABQ3JAX0_9RHOB|nr:hypothetical protein GCM10016455_30810 [Aliiroseovarius zhejiangensis]